MSNKGEWAKAFRELLRVKLGNAGSASNSVGMLIDAAGDEFDDMDQRLAELEEARESDIQQAHEQEVQTLRERIAELEQELLFTKKQRDEAVAARNMIRLQFSGD